MFATESEAWPMVCGSASPSTIWRPTISPPFATLTGRCRRSKDNRGFQYLAGLHGTPGYYCWHHQQNAPSARQMQLFPPWHRAYLYTWEMAMRDRVPGVTLPWWDWTLRNAQQSGIPSIFAQSNVDGQPNPLYSFHVNLPNSTPRLVRNTGRQPGDPGELPAQADVDDVLSCTDWNDFVDALENIHDAIHGWVGGDNGYRRIGSIRPD